MYGIAIRGGNVITGSIDGTIVVIDVETRQVRKHFLAHDTEEWGGKGYYSYKIRIEFRNMF